MTLAIAASPSATPARGLLTCGRHTPRTIFTRWQSASASKLAPSATPSLAPGRSAPCAYGLRCVARTPYCSERNRGRVCRHTAQPQSKSQYHTGSTHSLPPRIDIWIGICSRTTSPPSKLNLLVGRSFEKPEGDAHIFLSWRPKSPRGTRRHLWKSSLFPHLIAPATAGLPQKPLNWMHDDQSPRRDRPRHPLRLRTRPNLLHHAQELHRRAPLGNHRRRQPTADPADNPPGVPAVAGTPQAALRPPLRRHRRRHR